MAGKLALIGCGAWGRNILSDLLSLGAETVIVESDKRKRKVLEKEFSVLTAPDIQSLTDISSAVVATPASTHYDVIMKLLPFNVPIFAEKPITSNLEEARHLAEVGAGLIFVMHIWHYHPGIQQLAEICRNREFGKTNLLRTFRKNWTSTRTDVDSIWTLLPHDLTICKTVLGQIPEPVYAQAETLSGRAVSMLAVLRDKDQQAILDVSNRFADKRREVRLHCENGVVVMPDDRSGIIEIYRDNNGRSGVAPKPEIRNFQFKSPLKIELELFISYVQGLGPPPPTDIFNGLEVVENITKLRNLAKI